MAVHNANLDLDGNQIANVAATETVAVTGDKFLFLDATDGVVKGLDHSNLPGGSVALADVIDRYVWSYDTYAAGATVIRQKVSAPGTITAVRIIAGTATTGGESWTIFKNGATTSETVTLATTATEEDDTTGWTTTVVAGDDLYPDPTSSPSVASTNGSIVIEVTRT